MPSAAILAVAGIVVKSAQGRMGRHLFAACDRPNELPRSLVNRRLYAQTLTTYHNLTVQIVNRRRVTAFNGAQHRASQSSILGAQPECGGMPRPALCNGPNSRRIFARSS